MIADDVVEIRKISDNVLIGRAPDVIRHLMEIRGIGLVDVSVLYGMGAVMESKTITLCIHLAAGDMKDIDRLGVAVGNALDEIKEMADYISADNDHEGVTEVIEKFILGK